MVTIDLMCLGVGKGASYVLKGQPSTAFALRVDTVPTLLIDCGAGVALSYLRNLGEPLPSSIYISHNHMDHTGDLPIVIGVTLAKPRLLGHPTVLGLVREHRLHDAPELIATLDDRVEWIMPSDDNHIYISDELSLEIFPSIHSYTCYGFVLKHAGIPILGYSGDSAYDEKIYTKITQAPIAIVDGRDQGNHDHASLQDIDVFAARVPNCSLWVVHYEATHYMFRAANVKLMCEGDVVQLL